MAFLFFRRCRSLLIHRIHEAAAVAYATGDRRSFADIHSTGRKARQPAVSESICLKRTGYFKMIRVIRGMRRMGIRPKLKWGVVPLAGILVAIGSLAHCETQQEISGLNSKWERVFLFTGTRFGIPVLKASITVGNGSIEQGSAIYQIRAAVNSMDYLGFLFRMNNRFISTVDARTCVPIRYVKEINQEGLLIKNKNYVQTLIFDHPDKKVIVEENDGKDRKEIPVSSETYDPLSIFARYYLKEEIQPGEDVPMSIFDGVKLRQMVFHSKKETLESKIYGRVEAILIESTTSFSTFGEQEGTIRIWYSADGKKIPLSMELGLPIGDIHFELDEMKDG